MVVLRTLDSKRGLLGGAVALAVLFSSGILGYQLATAPADTAGVQGVRVGATAVAAAPGPAAAAPVPAAPAPAAPAPTAPAPAAPAPNALSQLPPEAATRLHQDGFTPAVWASSDAPDCAANSYGQTRTFLQQNRCVGVHRVLLDVRGPGPGEALVAVAWAQMSSADAAAQLKAVLDRPGSGNINSLNPSVPFTGRYYASKVDGTTAVNADVHPLVAGIDPQALQKIAADAIE